MQQPLSTGHGAPLQNSSTAPECHQQVPSKAPLAPTAGLYDFTYYQNNYQASVHNIVRPSLCPTSLGTPQGPGQMHNALPLGPNLIAAGPRFDPVFVSTPPQVGYVPSGGHYPGQVHYNVPSQSTTQGIPPSSSYPGFSYHHPMPVFNTQYNAHLTSQTVHPVAAQPLVGVLSGHVKPLPETGQRPIQASFQPYPAGDAAASWQPLPRALMTTSTGPVINLPAVASSANSQTSTGPPLSMPHHINQSYQPDRAKVATFPAIGAPLARRPPSSVDPPVSSSASPAPATEAHHDSTSSATTAPAPSDPCPLKSTKPFGYAYPTLQPGYQNVASPSHSVNQPIGPGYSPGPQQFTQPFSSVNQLSSNMEGLNLRNKRRTEALRQVSLLQERDILPPVPNLIPQSNLSPELKKLNCSPDLFRCTLMNIPQTQALLNKAKLPLGLLLHPFRDLTHLPVITSSTIVRCRTCRTYINPFVSFLDQRRWKCNLCYRVNDVPEEFMYNPLTRSYGEPHKRPEVQTATVEFIASSDYMLRPPQPAVYLFVFDVSHNAVESGYLNICCQSLLENFDKLPGDSRTRIGFITFDSTIHFFNLQEGLSQPQMLIVSDIEDIFLPTPDSLMVNLHESKELIKDLLKVLPTMFTNTRETHSALGPALQAAFKLMSATGGRISVFQTQLPSIGVGCLLSREDPNQRSTTKGVQHLAPATDFYKKFALDCSGQQVAVDLFLLSGQYTDLASLACMSKYSAGSVFYYPSFHHIHNPAQVEKFQKDLKRYLIRKIGFEAVMRIRCTKGLSIHTFHGNFFVRSTDLLSLANINPDSGFTVQMSIDENLVDTSIVCFQAALLYTSSKGERRIRVHTLCLPVVNSVADVYAGADVQAITCLLATMAVDRSVSSSLSDARDALVNAVVDSLSAYRSTVSNLQRSVLVAPNSLRLFALYILALLKQQAFRTGTSTRLDERVFAMCEMKTQPLVHLMLTIHPNLYRIDNLSDEGSIIVGDKTIPQPPILQLSAEKLSKEGAFLMDCGSVMYLWIGKNCSNNFISEVLGFPNYASIPQNMTHLPELNTILSQRTNDFVSWLRDSRPFLSIIYVVNDDGPMKANFYQKLVEDRTESALSYYEFLLHIQQQISK
ncbi:protein transport protein Sec24B [Rhincodon typus]|uniref:protein transport protein Sec24B n=1 Tax=Rhincodon typus TaxID=259920 RepID=UPI00202E80CC|nr:protein transport protein Sec24B [Rhincodon typus]XP_048454523.1 protein transport protein Sec24B [Rhincodon typus]